MSAFDYTVWVCDRCKVQEEFPSPEAPRPRGWQSDPEQAGHDLCDDCVGAPLVHGSDT